MKQTGDAFSIQSQTIDWIRFPFIILVVVHHVGDRVAPALPNFNLFDISLLHLTGDDFYHLFRAFFDTVKGICNPGFFLISGYFFFFNVAQWDATAYIDKLRKRVFTLLIPYLLWNLIAACTRPLSLFLGDRMLAREGQGRLPEYFQSIADKGFLNIFWNFTLWDESNVNILGWSMPSSGPVCIPLWFLQTLICLSIAAPAVYFVVRRMGAPGVCVLAVLCFTGIWFSVPGFAISSIFYFTLGAYFGINRKNMVHEFRRRRVALFSIAVLALIASICFEYGRLGVFNYAKGVFMLAATLSAVVIASYLVEKRIVRPSRSFSNSVFFIYASHSALLVVTAVGVLYEMLTFHSKAWHALTIGYIAIPVITVYLCYAAHLVLRWVLPSVSRTLSGNR